MKKKFVPEKIICLSPYPTKLKLVKSPIRSLKMQEKIRHLKGI